MYNDNSVCVSKYWRLGFFGVLLVTIPAIIFSVIQYKERPIIIANMLKTIGNMHADIDIACSVTNAAKFTISPRELLNILQKQGHDALPSNNDKVLIFYDLTYTFDENGNFLHVTFKR
jgi:hypothetical protein